MSEFIPNKMFLWVVLIYYFNINKGAVESHRALGMIQK